MKYTARKPFRYGSAVFMTGQLVSVEGDDVKMLQAQGKIGGPVIEKHKPEAPKIESAMVKPAEDMMQEKAIERAFDKAVVETVDYNELPYAELKEMCKERDLPVHGKKAELIERLEGE